MPAMPRFNKKANKIAFKILGVPAVLDFKRSKRQEYVNKMLISQDTYRVK